MKLCRYGAPGSEKPGLVDGAGQIRDLSHIWADIGPEQLAPSSLQALAKVDIEALPLVTGAPRFEVPVSSVSKCIGIGLNYADHAKEAGLPLPKEPIVFLKAPSALCGANDDTIFPPHASQLDWEVELGVVIGTTVRFIKESDALNYVAGYCLFNDISERHFQMQSSQWDKGKGCDRFGPTGPYLVTRDEIPDPQDLQLWLDVNGVRRQQGSTASMIFSVVQLISYLSQYMTLLPGDIIVTGTPPGVGMGHKPPTWLRPGDEVHLGITGLGEQRQKIVPPPG